MLLVFNCCLAVCISICQPPKVRCIIITNIIPYFDENAREKDARTLEISGVFPR